MSGSSASSIWAHDGRVSPSSVSAALSVLLLVSLVAAMVAAMVAASAALAAEGVVSAAGAPLLLVLVSC